jgi:hypothetical protein
MVSGSFLPWVDKNEQLKKTGKELCELMVSWLADAHTKTVAKIDLVRIFASYGWSSSEVSIPALPGYTLTPPAVVRTFLPRPQHVPLREPTTF